MTDQNEGELILYRNRPEWRDIMPVKQDNGEAPIVARNYTEIFDDCYGYFRAVFKSKEISERALELTQTAFNLNPGNYIVWQYRRELLQGLNKNIHEELELIQKLIFKHYKNYQVWHHRTVLVHWLQDPSKELPLTESVLKKDAENFHVWQHRQWVLKTFNLFNGELEFVDMLLSDNITNNSAWNQRYFVIEKTTGFTEEVLKREINYTLFHIKALIKNKSAWSYLRGLLRHDKGGLSKNKSVTHFCEELYNSGNRCPYLLAMLVDMCFEQVTEGRGNSVYTLERAKELCNGLKTKYDTIRAKYWRYMSKRIEKKA